MTCKVFVTGVSSALVSGFLSSFDPGKLKVYGLSRQEGLHIDSVEIINGDLLDTDSYCAVLQDVDVVLHVAALTHSTDEAAYYRVNTAATISLVDMALRAGVEKFVYVSSRSAVANAGAYGVSKLRAEEYVKTRFANYTVIRPSEVFGVGKSEGIEKLIADVVEKRVHLYPAGVPTKLSPVHVADVGKVLADSVAPQAMRAKTVTVGGAQEFAYDELIKAIGRWIDKPKTALPLPAFALKLFGALLRITRIKIAIVPDQVQRLYAVKEEVNHVPSPPTVTLKDYVLGRDGI